MGDDEGVMIPTLPTAVKVGSKKDDGEGLDESSRANDLSDCLFGWRNVLTTLKTKIFINIGIHVAHFPM